MESQLASIGPALPKSAPAFESVFDRVFDVVVVGSGYAGFAAAMALGRAGRSVLLVGSRGDVVWESGRGFCPEAGSCADPGWCALVDAVDQHAGHSRGDGVHRSRGEGWVDGAITEVVATDQLLASDVSVLYYARAVAVERGDNGGASSVVVATKSGLRRVAGRQWVDATESGELLRLSEPGLLPRAPRAAYAYLMLQHADWSTVGAAADALKLHPTAWPTERVLSVEVKPDDVAWREQVLAALAELDVVMGEESARVSMSHWSIEPVAQYSAGAAGPAVVSNIANAVPGLGAATVVTLADRFMLGVRAAATLLDEGGRDDARASIEACEAALSQPLPRVEPVQTVRTQVCVGGAGTGGAVAALAAAKTGASVVCVEPYTFAGGIGTGGGIHLYWLGVAGGLQREVDQRTKDLMRRFRGGPLGDGPFNPWAKMIALEQLLREQGVDLRTDALAFDVEKDGDRAVAVLVTTPSGVLRIAADAFVDGTGDGDLSALAGAELMRGRAYDDRPQPYSQSSGRLRELHARPRMQVVNYDAGFCDPTDPEDMTRARLTGIHQYLRERYDNLDRPTYIAPALGLRGSRQVVTDYVLTLDDQISRRRFDDPIGYTGSGHGSHGRDYEFESDEAIFWKWANRQVANLFGCEMPYRMLLPRGLANVWVASRCVGVSQDAHYATRMQRDIQRVGEAAGFAAAEAAKRGETSRDLPYGVLRTWLDTTGALDNAPADLDTSFGSTSVGGPVGTAILTLPDEQSSVDAALAALDRAEPGEAIWWLYRHPGLVRDAVLEQLDTTTKQRPFVSWLAAGVAAMWHDPAAEPRLTHAINTLEYGFGDGYEWTPARPVVKFSPDPLEVGHVNGSFVPNWLCAITLLRRCGTEACIPVLNRLLEHPAHALNTLTATALTLTRLAQRGILTTDDARSQAETMLDRMPHMPVVGAFNYAGSGRLVGLESERAIRGELDAITQAREEFLKVRGEKVARAYEDNSWQLHLAVARARLALGLPAHDAAAAYRHDHRALVRRAFDVVAEGRWSVVA